MDWSAGSQSQPIQRVSRDSNIVDNQFLIFFLVKNVVEVREWFKHRKDHLETRVSNKQTKQIVEKFAPGRSDGKHLKGNAKKFIYCT